VCERLACGGIILEEANMPWFCVSYLIWSGPDECRPDYSDSLIIEAADTKAARRLSVARIAKKQGYISATPPIIQIVRIRQFADGKAALRAVQEQMSGGGMCVVVTGTPADGFAFHGPFGYAQVGGDWAEREHSKDYWWIARLERPVRAPWCTQPPNCGPGLI
jgi:hypothetical protein